MTQLIGILAILIILVLIGLLFWPVLRDRSGSEFYRTGITRQKERQTRMEFLSRRIADLDLDRDSGKLSIEEHAGLVASLNDELARLKAEPEIMGSVGASEKGRKKARTATALLCVLSGATALPLSVSLLAAPVIIEGSIRNGTTGKPAKAAKLELLKIAEGMQSIEVLENAGPAFRFKAVEQAGAPLLVRATYENDTFVSVIPPSQAPETPNQPPLTSRNDITVFEGGAKLSEMDFHSGLQISRLRDGLDVTLVYAINNNSKPQRSFDISSLNFPVPTDAKELQVSVAHQDAGMPVTLEAERVPGGIRMKRSLRPGTSELSIRFRTGDHSFHDRIDFTKELLVNRKGGEQRPFFRVLIWRPADAMPEIEGGTGRELDIPNLGKAMQVVYTSNEVTYHFKSGSVWFENPMASDENPIFDHPWKSFVGVLLAVTLLLLVLSILTGSRIRLTRETESTDNRP